MFSNASRSLPSSICLDSYAGRVSWLKHVAARGKESRPASVDVSLSGGSSPSSGTLLDPVTKASNFPVEGGEVGMGVKNWGVGGRISMHFSTEK